MCWIFPALLKQRREPQASTELHDRVQVAIERIDRAAAEISVAVADIRHASREEPDR